MDWNQISQLGGTVIISLFLIKEMFAYLRTRGGNGKTGENGEKYVTQKEFATFQTDLAIAKNDLHEIKTNHLKHIEAWMEKHDKEHDRDRELLVEIAVKMGIDNKRS